MKIILLRHGKPTFDESSWRKCHQMDEWCKKYDISGISSPPPVTINMQVSSARCILSSPLPRAISSLNALQLHPDVIHYAFKEVELPVFYIPLINLPPKTWLICLRLLWLAGFSRNTESLKLAKLRASEAANILIGLATESKHPVLLMGHGFMNELIVNQLTSLGWKTIDRKGKGYWKIISLERSVVGDPRG